MTEFNRVYFIKHGSVETVIVVHLVQIFLATYGDKLFIPVFTIPAASMLSPVALLESAILDLTLLTPTLYSFLRPACHVIHQCMLHALLISLPLIRSPQKYLRKNTVPKIRLNARPPSAKLLSQKKTPVDCDRLKTVCCRILIARNGVVTAKAQ